MNQEIIEPNTDEPIINLKDALEERYLAYALSTIMHRALPDVRDGLKPVHRRVLHAMRLLKLNPEQGYKKCARVVGDVIGKYHPHGDQAVYDAMVRLAQDFAVRYPLVNGQGNFGNIDGDNAAAMRYTEAKLTDVAMLLLEGIDENAVDFRETYDGENDEPIVLPGAFPNLLANGSSGIAVGMATNIPPHNVFELCEAALMLIEKPNVTTEDLVQIVPGPDLPTGGIIVEPKEKILEAYETGKGGFKVRARWHTEEVGRGQYVIIVTEIPYQVQKSRLIERIADLMLDKKIPLLADVRDESAEDIRVVLEPKSKAVDPNLLMAALFKLTELESRISLNLNVLSHGQIPNVLGLKSVLSEWLDHRQEVLVRRSNYRLEKIEARLHILEGYLKAYLDIDEVIRIIREDDEPKPALMKRFDLSEIQAEAVLNLRLRALRKLEEFEINKEHKELSEERDKLKALIGSEAKQWKAIASQIKEVQKTFDKSTDMGKRRTDFADAPKEDEYNVADALVEKEPVTVVLSQRGWIRALRGHNVTEQSLSFKGDDALKYMVQAQTTDKLLALAGDGRVFTIGVDKLPGGRGNGEPLRLMIDLDEADDIIDLCLHRPGEKLLFAAKDGRGFIAPEDGIIATTKKGKQVLNLKDPIKAMMMRPVQGDHVAVVGENRKLLIFPIADLPEMGRGRGVMLQRYKDGGLSDITMISLEEGLSWPDPAGRMRKETELAEWIAARASAGRIVPRGFPKSGKFSG